MRINVERAPSYSVIHVSGRVDTSCAPELRRTILDLFRKRSEKTVIVNLSEVQSLDSSGVAALIEGQQEAQKGKRRFVLVGLSEGARHVLELVQLLDMFEICASVQDVKP